MIALASQEQANPWIDALRRLLPRAHQSIRPADQARMPPFRPWAIAGLEQHTNHRREYAEEYLRRVQLMREMVAINGSIDTDAYCIACGGPRKLRTDPAGTGAVPADMPNWREGLICRGCQLNSRMRASIHLLLWALADQTNCGIYITEQVTALYRWVKMRFPNAVGSEYLSDGTRSGGCSSSGIRHEDLTDLSFADESFNVVVSLEVLEHIPDFTKAISECARVLKPGGKLLISVPFHAGPRHTLRARVSDNGTIEHLLPAEYHGDPLNGEGCLCFHHFGWDLMDFLKAAGFRLATAFSIWSRELGYLATEGEIIEFIAVK
jgi:SAM-dependent methyltransferase